MATLAAGVLLSHAQSVPSLINYQGRLSNPNGSELPTADYQVSFSIYDSATNASGRLWGPQIFSSVPVVHGYFNVLLGPTDTNGLSIETAFTNPSTYVEIRVATNDAIRPRQRILSAPFAFQAANAAKLAGYDWGAVFDTSNPATGKIPGAKLQSQGITTAQLAPYSVTLTNLAPRQVGTNVGVGGFAVSSNSGSQTFISTNNTGANIFNVTNLVVTIVTTGRPVFVGLIGGDPFSAQALSVYRGLASFPKAYIDLLRDSSFIKSFACESSVSGGSQGDFISIPPASFSTIDFPASGTHTYSIQAEMYGANVIVSGCRLIAFEL